MRLVFRRMSANPFLDSAFHIRWSTLAPEHVASAIEAALAQARAAVEEIAGRDLGSLTYANTFLALENSTEALNLAWAKVTHLQSVVDSPALRDAHNAMLPGVSAFYASIPLNAGLWRRLKAVAATAARGLSGFGAVPSPSHFFATTVATRAARLPRLFARSEL